MGSVEILVATRPSVSGGENTGAGRSRCGWPAATTTVQQPAASQIRGGFRVVVARGLGAR